MNQLELFQEHPKAKTVGGRLLEYGRELLRYGNGKDELERAKYQDFLAEALADTVAILPRYGAAAAGLSRATLLIKPDDSFYGNVKSFAANAAEGMALRKVASMAAPDLRAGWLPNSGAFLAQGFGFGTVKGAFKSENWFDPKGEFSLKSGTWNTLSSGLYASALNLPAGFLGTKIATLALEKTVSAGLGPRVGMLSAGITSGYGTGFVIGGTNAFAEGRRGLELLSASHDAGLVSSISSGTLMALSPLRFSAFKQPAEEDLRGIAGKEYSGRKQSESDYQVKEPPWISDNEYFALELGNRKELSPQRILKKSMNFEPAKENTPVLKDDFPYGVPLRPDWLYRAMVTRKEPWDLRMYQDRSGKTGLGPMFVKEEFARKLDASLGEPIIDADGALRLPAPHHIEIKTAMERVPDPSIVKRIDVRLDRDIYTPFHRRVNLDPFFELTASANARTGRIGFSTKSGDRNLNEIADHEWSHLLEPKVPRQRAMFEVAALVEKDGYFVSPYARLNGSENWAEHTASFLGNPHRFLEFVHNAPLRAVALSRAIESSVQNMEARLPGFTDKGLRARLEYTERNILPLALTDLRTRLSTSMDKAEAARSAMLLGALGDKADLQTLAGRASNHAFTKSASYLSVLSRLENDQFIFHAYEGRKIQDGNKQLADFVAYHLNPANKSYSRGLAFEGLLNQTYDRNLTALSSSDSFGQAVQTVSPYLYYIVR